MFTIRAFSALACIFTLIACSAAPADNGDVTASSTDEALRAPTCKTADDCNAAFENGTWKIASSKVDECVANHDFPYVCMGCSTKHRCTFSPGF